MDVALKVMFALRKTGDSELAALKKARSGYRNARKTRSTLGNHVFSPIERRYEFASKMRNFRESVWPPPSFTAIIGVPSLEPIAEFLGGLVKEITSTRSVPGSKSHFGSRVHYDAASQQYGWVFVGIVLAGYGYCSLRL